MGNHAKTYQIEGVSRFIMGAVEDEYGTFKNPNATDVIATEELKPKIKEGSSKTINFDGGNGVDMPEITSNNYNSFDFKIFGAASGTKGKPPIAGKLFRVCGANEIITDNDNVTYEPADISAMDSGSFVLFKRRGEGEYLRFATAGARGQVGFSFKESEKPSFTISNLMGSYERPTEFNQSFAVNYGDQKQKLPLDVNFKNTAELSLGGHALCVSSFEIDNVFGVTTSRRDAPGCRSTRVQKTTPIINMTVTLPDFEEAFNPYEWAETDNGIRREPLVFQLGNTGEDDGNILIVKVDEAQLTQPQETMLDDGTEGLTFQLRCLSGVTLTYK